MSFPLFFWGLFLLCFDFDSMKCEAEDVEATCDTICKCEVKRNQISSKEFRAVCEGDGTKRVVLNTTLFGSEPVPDWTRKSYIRIMNFTGAKIEEDFLSRWSAYTSCSFDIWNSGKIIFPPNFSGHARTQAITFVFAGIGVLASSIEKFPDGLFDKKSSIGLKLVNSSIDYLNLFKLSAKYMHHLIVKNSVIKAFDGNPSRSLTLVGSIFRGDARVEIEDSKIGYLSENALSFNDYRSRTKAKISIKRSTIGIMEKSAIKIGRNISLQIKESNLLVSALNFVDGHNSPSSITRNFIGVEDNAMNQLKCDSSLHIQDNLIYTKEVLTDCILDGYEAETSPSCGKSLEISNYLDSSCENNHIVGKYYPPPPIQPSTTTISSTTTTPPPTTQHSTTTTLTTTSITTTVVPSTTTSATLPSTTTTTTPTITTPCMLTITPLPLENNATSLYYPESKTVSGSTIPFGLFCVVIGFCFFLCITVAVLAGVLAYRKRHKREEKLTNNVRFTACANEEVMYEQPEVHFSPTAACQVTLGLGTFTRAKTKEQEQEEAERYQEFPMRKEKKVELVEDDTPYLTMTRSTLVEM